jgi:enoyl-CoA hydratase/carnithine racemase
MLTSDGGLLRGSDCGPSAREHPVDYESIDYRIEDRIATIVLNRPDRLNAVTTKMLLEFADAVRRVDEDDEVRVAVVTGAGRAFCAGGDISGGADVFDPAVMARAQSAALREGNGVATEGSHRETGAPIALNIFYNRKPFIAAINGAAVGVGLTMVLPMDIRLSVPGAKLGLVFVRRGVVSEACSSWFLPRIVGISQAVDWAVTGRIFLAEEALSKGLLSGIHPPDELLPAAYAIARDIVETTSPVAVALTRRMFYSMLCEAEPSAAVAAESRNTFIMGGSPDVAEGVQSFLEKRPPRFPMVVTEHVPAAVGAEFARPFSNYS